MKMYKYKQHSIKIDQIYLIIIIIVITISSYFTPIAQSSTLNHDNNHRNRLNKRQSSNSDTNQDNNRIRIPSSLCNGQSYPLGMESGDIQDHQIIASSSYNLQSVGPQNARLNRELSGGAWCPSKQLSASYSGQEWIQINLEDFYIITAIATQGRFGNGMGVEFAEEYWIEYSRDNGTTWNKWIDMNGDYKLLGNHDTYTAHKNILSHPLVAISLIRIVPFANYQRTTCLRFELYGCRHDTIQIPLTYSIPDGYKDTDSFGDLRDLTYDGRIDYYGYLHGGLGQLIDGIKGDDNYKVNYGYEWIGWKTENADLSMVFEFATIVNFTSATFYCHNLFTKQIQVFSGAKVWLSYDGQIWSKRPIEFEYMPDLALENPRDVDVHLYHKAARFIKFDFQFASKWILMSEVSFTTERIDENQTLTYEQLDWSFNDNNDNLMSTFTTINNEHQLFPQTTLFIVFAFVFIIICTVIVILLRLHLKRKEKAGHIVVCMKDLATTPLYCEPKDFSSTSSTISNTIADPEYAVPDVAISNHQQLPNYNMSILPNDNTNVKNQTSNIGHLGNNLNMFGAGFTRIFMMGNNATNNTNHHQSLNDATKSTNANQTANVVYSLQSKLPTASDNNNNNNSGSCYNLSKQIPLTSKTLNVHLNNANNLMQRQFYVSADLIPKSPKLSSKSTKIDQANNNNRITCNTIYNKRKMNDDHMSTNSNTLKFKYQHSANTVNPNDMIEETLKCIPEINEQQIEIIQNTNANSGQPFGYSQYGQILLARLSLPQKNNTIMTLNGNQISNKNGYANDNANNINNNNIDINSSSASTETDAVNGGENIGNSTNINDNNDTLVILKTLENDKLRNDFVHEMKSKWFISAKSERIAKLFGYLTSPTMNLTAMIIEYGECDLAQFLRNCDKKSIGIQSLLHIGSEVAAGMKYLESLGYVHRDLSAKNCIIFGDNLRVKISDFAASLSSNGHDYYNGLAIRWIAPEALINGTYTTKSDVYSFGITFWEILTYALIRPHHELDDNEFLQKLFNAYDNYVTDINNDCSSSSIYYQATYAASASSIANNNNASINDNTAVADHSINDQQQKRNGTTRISYRLALPRPTTCPSEIYDLMLECWQLNEQIRPSFKDITQFLYQRNNLINNNNKSNVNIQTNMHQIHPQHTTHLQQQN